MAETSVQLSTTNYANIRGWALLRRTLNFSGENVSVGRDIEGDDWREVGASVGSRDGSEDAGLDDGLGVGSDVGCTHCDKGERASRADILRSEYDSNCNIPELSGDSSARTMATSSAAMRH